MVISRCRDCGGTGADDSPDHAENPLKRSVSSWLGYPLGDIEGGPWRPSLTRSPGHLKKSSPEPADTRRQERRGMVKSSRPPSSTPPTAHLQFQNYWGEPRAVGPIRRTFVYVQHITLTGAYRSTQATFDGVSMFTTGGPACRRRVMRNFTPSWMPRRHAVGRTEAGQRGGRRPGPRT
jgi:hypothetical protein